VGVPRQVDLERHGGKAIVGFVDDHHALDHALLRKQGRRGISICPTSPGSGAWLRPTKEGGPRQTAAGLLARLSLDGANRNEVVVGNRPNVTLMEGHERLRSARRGHELHLEPVWFVDFDDCAKVASL